MTPAEIENLAGLWADMIRSGEATGSMEAFETVGEREGWDVADAMCVHLNNWNVPLITDTRSNA